ncbi:biopolymer transporter ExbD [Vibrio sp. D431a]|uniref:biopolymer transporter ExbD n=1 Tax=Vibrio sp. D431a TaxID=2837388 RepID=UPI0025552FAD|nr:biopolymer transporter ExbD [Vibrio sp. D431a]MDK9790597.1 biopolymer transporter ExbD [Vibrio sp. D431a]
MRRQLFTVDEKVEMNIVPMIDVMLVLLIIFMATTPTITSNIHIDVPQVSVGKSDSPESMTPNTVIVSLDNKANLYLTVPRLGMIDEKKEPSDISSFIAAVLREESDTKVYLRSDGKLPYQTVADAMNLLKKSGTQSINLVTVGEVK